MTGLGRIAALCGLAVGGVLAIAALWPGSGDWFAERSLGEVGWISMYGAFAIVLMSSLLLSYRGRGLVALGHLAVWAALFLVAVSLYAYKDDLRAFGRRLLGELDPGFAYSSAPGEVSVVSDSNGRFIVDAVVEGRSMRLEFDTGASEIELTAQDAERIGLAPSRLAYTTRVDTANGVTRAADVVLDAVRIGPIEMRRVAAVVAQPGALRRSLLGRSFLDRLGGYSVENSRLILRAPQG